MNSFLSWYISLNVTYVQQTFFFYASLSHGYFFHTPFWCGFSSFHLISDYLFSTPFFLFSTSLFVFPPYLDPSFISLVSFSPHLIWIHSLLTSSHFLLDPLSRSSFLLPPYFHPPPMRGFYLAILSGSMCISPFSMNNIFIHKGMSSNNLLLGPAANFLSTLLKGSLHSIENSIIHPSFTCLN